jgi:hypothetical protein
MVRVAVVGLSLFLLSGCAFSPSADVIKALAGDPATVCVQVATPYGNVRVARTNLQNGNLNCSNDGLQLKSDAASVGVPVNIVPQISIGAPISIKP